MEVQDIKRRKTRPVYVGSVKIGDDAPVVVQSMTCTDTRDIKSTVAQIKRLEDAGCEIVRVAVPDHEAAEALSFIKKSISIPLIADIHFKYQLAIEAIESGADCIRINPGNIKRDSIKEVVAAAKERDVSIRIGVNAGSLEKDIMEKHGGPAAAALVESTLRNIALFEDLDFTDIKLSLKSSDVLTMIEAYREISKLTDYPLHLGVTEAGTIVNSAIKSSIGLGILLHEGIGDTIRVSISGDPVSEVSVAFGILRALGIRLRGSDRIVRGGGAAVGGNEVLSEDCPHGVCGQRSRRGSRCGHRDCRRPQDGTPVQKRYRRKENKGRRICRCPSEGDSNDDR